MRALPLLLLPTLFTLVFTLLRYATTTYTLPVTHYYLHTTTYTLLADHRRRIAQREPQGYARLRSTVMLMQSLMILWCVCVCVCGMWCVRRVCVCVGWMAVCCDGVCVCVCVCCACVCAVVSFKPWVKQRTAFWCLSTEGTHPLGRHGNQASSF